MVEKKYIGSDLIADFFILKKIDTVFGVIGSANAYIFDSIIKKGYTKIIYMHHEQSVVMAAGAYYRSSGKMSAAIVTAGGGAANAITGVVCNWADSIPCLVIAGQENSKYITEHNHLRMYGTQGYNTVKMVQNVTKFATCITNIKSLLTNLEEAYYKCLSDRPGPVWLDIPTDIQSFKLDNIKLESFNKPNPIIYDFKLNKVIDLLRTAKRPVILAGHGVKLSNSIPKFKTLVNKLQIPVLLSWLGIDVLPESNPYNFGRPGLYGQRRSNFIIQNCDLLLVIGSRLSLPQTGYNIDNFAPDAKIIIVNNDLNELQKHIGRYDLPIEADCSAFIDNLLEQNENFYRDEWYNKCVEYSKQFPTIEPHHLEDNKTYNNSYVIIDNLSDILDDNAIIILDQGTPLASGHQALKLKNNQIVFASNGLGEMGNGLPSAIGAAIANPTKQIIALIADGSTMMNLQEFQTVVGYKLPIKFILFNNKGYLFIKHTQKMLFEGRYTGVNEDTGVSMPNYEKLSNAFGITYTNTHTHSINDILNISGPVLYEVFMNPEQELSPKVRGIVTNEGILPPPLEEMSPLLSLQDIESNMITKLNKISYKIQR
jgi:acetolactate synthase-1/2/3 large subunit